MEVQGPTASKVVFTAYCLWGEGAWSLNLVEEHFQVSIISLLIVLKKKKS